MIPKPLASAERQVPAGFQAFNWTKLAVSFGRQRACRFFSVDDTLAAGSCRWGQYMGS